MNGGREGKAGRYPYIDATPLVGARDRRIQNLFAKLSLTATFPLPILYSHPAPLT